MVCAITVDMGEVDVAISSTLEVDADAVDELSGISRFDARIELLIFTSYLRCLMPERVS